MRHVICLLSLVKTYYVKTSNENRNYGFPKGFSHERISGGKIPLLPYEMPHGLSQGRWQKQQGSRGSRRTDTPESHVMGETFPGKRTGWSLDRFRTGKETHPAEVGRAGSEGCHREASAKCGQGKRGIGEKHRQESLPRHPAKFFISIGARFGRIRKSPKGKPSPQHYDYCKELLHKLEELWELNHIDLYYGDESHVCTEGYVPYGWILPGEECVVPSLKDGRLNIFGMVDRNCNYHGFTTTESINSHKFIEFVDRFSMSISRPTVLVVDNASIHKSKKIKSYFKQWNERGLYIFYLQIGRAHV